MKKFLTMLAIAAMVTSFVACDDDESTPDGPSLTAPAVTSVEVETSADITFPVTVPGGYKSVAATATGGSVTTKSEPAAGATSGDIVVTFTADATAGAGTVTITVTDKNNKTESETAAINKAEEVTVITVSANITANTTWETGKTYILGGRIAVVNGVTLTIEPGVVVKGQAGTGSNATALLIARGGKLMAEGTAAAPIVFTSVADEITPEDIAAGNLASPNLESDVNGLWGGLIVLGKAKISASNDNDQDVSEIQIEGIPTSDTNGLYGGTDDADNSGVLKYISIRHGGSNIGSGNEINGLTLGGVGSGTVIDHIEVVSNQDDGIEWFGGTVNVSNVVVWNVGDDAIDTDQSWSGTLNNFLVVTPTGSCFELDGPEGTYAAGHTIQNGTIVASNDDVTAGALIDVDANSIVNLTDLYFTSIVAGQLIDRVSCDNNGCPYSGIQLNVPGGTTIDDFLAGATTGVTAVATPTVGANASVFGWTWTSKAGALAGL